VSPDFPMSDPSTQPPLRVILAAPNVSEQMGGESIKALQIYIELERQGIPVYQVTHERVEPELSRKFPGMKVSCVTDGWVQRLIHRTRVLMPALNVIFQFKALKLIEKQLREWPDAVVHYTSPVSPVLPYFRTPGATVVIGPINGNIHHPPAFRYRETAPYWVRRWLHPYMQFLHRLFFRGKQSADALLVAGGERTAESLRMAGCRDEQMVPSIDSGVMDRLADAPRVEHHGENLRFVHNGRLQKHKGADLAIKALTRTKNRVTLDVIGRGPEAENLKALVASLNLGDRVKFIPWFKDHNELSVALREYRAFVFPSICEANGIVVQEAMIMGLPTICADWGGPALLITTECGVLVKPTSEEEMLSGLAEGMDRLATDGELAERMSVAGRKRALDGRYIWSGVVKDWVEVYRQALAKHRARGSGKLVEDESGARVQKVA
jgi:glycosyltransferase involved in cell wall biosynthesis